MVRWSFLLLVALNSDTFLKKKYSNIPSLSLNKNIKENILSLTSEYAESSSYNSYSAPLLYTYWKPSTFSDSSLASCTCLQGQEYSHRDHIHAIQFDTSSNWQSIRHHQTNMWFEMIQRWTLRAVLPPRAAREFVLPPKFTKSLQHYNFLYHSTFLTHTTLLSSQFSPKGNSELQGFVKTYNFCRFCWKDISLLKDVVESGMLCDFTTALLRAFPNKIIL